MGAKGGVAVTAGQAGTSMFSVMGTIVREPSWKMEVYPTRGAP